MVYGFPNPYYLKFCLLRPGIRFSFIDSIIKWSLFLSANTLFKSLSHAKTKQRKEKHKLYQWDKVCPERWETFAQHTDDYLLGYDTFGITELETQATLNKQWASIQSAIIKSMKTDIDHIWIGGERRIKFLPENLIILYTQLTRVSRC